MCGAPGGDPRLFRARERREVAQRGLGFRADVDAVVREAIPALPDRSRAVLRYHLLDGWSIDQIGDLYGVHRATPARWLTTARDELRDRVRTGLAARLDIGESQVDSIVALVTSRIELSLERLLGDA